MSWGSGPWGSSPWGGFSDFAPTSTEFDLYCFDPSTIASFLSSSLVDVFSSGGQVFIDGNNDLAVASGGTYSTDDARVYVTTVVPEQWTLEFTAKFSDLPQDFNDLVYQHIFVGVTDAAGPCAGLFFSKQGLAYAGAIRHVGGDLILDSILQPIPGSSAYIDEDEYLTVRIAADSSTSAVYVFVTPTVEVGVTGHVLRAILPIILSSSLASPTTDRTTISVRGTISEPSLAAFDTICLSSSLVMPNLAPIADAGQDQAINLCSIVLLDGTGSFDPEGAPLLYLWRLIEAPVGSTYVFQGKDGSTTAGSGFVDKFYSDELSAEDALAPVTPGDVLSVGGIGYDIIGKGTDINGFFVAISAPLLPQGLAAAGFKLLRQNGINGPTLPNPTFFPDTPGFYKFDLIVSDGMLSSDPSGIDRAPVVINVLESPLPRGCTPDLSFVFNYLSDFWKLVEDRDVLSTFWSALAQVAATELYTLWQHEYGKSLRDIQRVFCRRWLHYDLLLPEPLPELTKIRTVWGGVLSAAIDDTGTSAAGTTVVLESEALSEPATFQFYGPDPITPEQVLVEVSNRLAEIDKRFVATLVDDRVFTQKYVRIDAPFPFTIGSDSTTSLFGAGDSNGVPSGTGGAVVGLRVYKTELPLAGMGIKENDLLVVGGVGYRIAQIIDDPTDRFSFQRVVVKETFPTTASADWVISGCVTSELLDFYNGLVSAGDVVYFEVTDPRTNIATNAATHEIVQTTVFGTNETLSSSLAFDPVPIGSYLARPAEAQVRLAKVVRRSYVPISDLVQDIPILQDVVVIEDEQRVVRRNLDFFLEQYRGRSSIRFESAVGRDIWEGQTPPDRLWAEYTYIDNRPDIEANFGIPVEFTLDHLAQLSGQLDYLSAVRGLWYAYTHGPTVHNLRVGAQILLGLPFAEQAGTIEEIRTDFSSTSGRVLIRDADDKEIVRSYTYPRALELEVNPATGAKYKADDVVEQFAPLVSGAEVIDYVKDPTWFEGVLNQGVFYEVEKFFKFLVRVDSAVFSLSTLLFVRNFMLKIKPTYTTPLLVVKYDVSGTGTDISVVSTALYKGSLSLWDTPCTFFLGATTKYDDPRAAGGGYRNQFDEDPDPGTPDPTYPTPDAGVMWAWDKQFLCPEDEPIAEAYIQMDGVAAIDDDSVFPFGSNLHQYFFFAASPVTDVPLAGEVIGLDGMRATANDAIDNGTLSELTLIIWGNSGTDPKDYELVVAVAGVDQTPIPFTVGQFGFEATFDVSSISVSLGDTITVKIRPASGAVDRSPFWQLVRVKISDENVVIWNNMAVPPEGTYGVEWVLT